VSKNVAVFVDVANLYYSARGQEVDVDYVALLKAATKGRDLIRAYAYSGLDPENENQRKFIDFLNKNGYKVVHKDIRKFGDGRVKANLDIELVVDMFRLSKRMDIAVVVSGDGDFAAAIRALQDEGVRCEVISFRPNTSSDLIAVADEFIDIMKIASIGRGKKAEAPSKGMSAPEMPAKEVVPEFGFREASASVAAAALAALREGKEPRPSGRGTRGGRVRPAAATTGEAAEAPVGAPAAGGDEHGDETRRRRRRRGGRGRGRGGRNDAAAEGTLEQPEATGEIGWTELDDISQIDEMGGVGPLTDDAGEEREYTFEEADEATLAELGLLGGDVATLAEPAEATVSETEAKPRRRTRSRKADAEGSAQDAEAETEAKPARRTRSRKAADAASEAAPDAAPKRTPRSRKTTTAKSGPADERGDPKKAPARRTSRARTKKADDMAGGAASGEATAGGEGDDQGIWQRFRSARKRTDADS
jgi:uncharacterized LabA/DUF88 family protein